MSRVDFAGKILCSSHQCMKHRKKAVITLLTLIVLFSNLFWKSDSNRPVHLLNTGFKYNQHTVYTEVLPVSVSGCTDPTCVAMLTEDEFAAYKHCEHQVHNVTGVDPGQIMTSCKFINGTGRKVVALVSETGSGNTWVRGLLEKTTGVCTGAIYCDPALRNGGMIGEFVIGPSVLVVKTHTPDYQWDGIPHPDRESDPQHRDGNYGGAILLLRNPFDAFVSEWNRYVTIQKVESVAFQGLSDNSHVHSLGKEMFGSNREWSQFLQVISNRWYNVYTRWFSSAVANKIPILVVRYEDIKQDKVVQVERMLNFLDFKVDKDDIVARLNQGFKRFQRDHNVTFKHYTVSQIRRVNSIILKAANYLKQYATEYVFSLEEYLHS